VLVSQMPGRIVRLLVSTGDPVTKGQPMMVIEAMKMENELKAPVGGFVAEVYVSEGSAVEAGAKLARVDP
jgi:biotin carboxyl carrier protein